MKLSEALLCLECDELFERYPDYDMNRKIIGYRDNCPSCGNAHCVRLTRWFNGLHTKKKEAEIKNGYTPIDLLVSIVVWYWVILGLVKLFKHL